MKRKLLVIGTALFASMMISGRSESHCCDVQNPEIIEFTDCTVAVLWGSEGEFCGGAAFGDGCDAINLPW